MNCKLICLSILLSCVLTGYSQQQTDLTNVTKVTILNPGVSYEARIAKFQTIYVQGFMSTSGYFSYSEALGTNAAIYFDPAVDIQYRFYYDGIKRFEKEKRTEMNSMNYVAVISEIVFSKRRLTTNDIDEANRRAVSRFGIGWGFQRNYTRHFSLDLNLGIGYQFSKGTGYNYNGQTTTRNISMLTGMGQLNIGFWLGKKKE